jgi:hypothetical protein
MSPKSVERHLETRSSENSRLNLRETTSEATNVDTARTEAEESSVSSYCKDAVDATDSTHPHSVHTRPTNHRSPQAIIESIQRQNWAVEILMNHQLTTRGQKKPSNVGLNQISQMANDDRSLATSVTSQSNAQAVEEVVVVERIDESPDVCDDVQIDEYRVIDRVEKSDEPDKPAKPTEPNVSQEHTSIVTSVPKLSTAELDAENVSEMSERSSGTSVWTDGQLTGEHNYRCITILTYCKPQI